jgi:hypothetical protein
MNTVRLQSMTKALTAPPSWPILTRRSTAASNGETVNGQRADRGAQSRRSPRLSADQGGALRQRRKWMFGVLSMATGRLSGRVRGRWAGSR